MDIIRTRWPVDVVMSQDTPPLFYYKKNRLSSGCYHVTGRIVLWMLSCDRTRCPMDVVMSQDTLSYGCCHVTGHSPPCFIFNENVIHSLFVTISEATAIISAA